MAPSTSYILDALRDLYIKHADPSKMGMNPINGLEEKENDLKKITHEMLASALPDYDVLESQVAATMGSNFSKLLCGAGSVADLKLIPPAISFSSFYPAGNSSSSSSSSSPDSNIYVGEEYDLETIISGGNMALTGWDYSWFLVKNPPLGDAEIREISSDIYESYWHILSGVKFTYAGFYSLQMILKHKVYAGLEVKQIITATVIDP